MWNHLKSLPELPVPQPTLFVGHGSPMNILSDNEFTRRLQNLVKVISYTPKAIVVVSAHWYTEGTHVTAGSNLETIYDFFGFPDELYAVQYPAPGFPELAKSSNYGLDMVRGQF